MKGTEKQIAWAEDIKKQVMDAAHEVYEDENDIDRRNGVAFEQTPVGHAATFAAEHADDARFWIRAVGYQITDYRKRSEDAKCTADLESIIKGMMVHFTDIGCGEEGYDLYEQYLAEENDLRKIRHAALEKAWAAKKAAKKAKREKNTK